jgi:hypothetical protein
MKKVTETIQKKDELAEKIETAKLVLEALDRISVKNKAIFARIDQNTRTRNTKL